MTILISKNYTKKYTINSNEKKEFNFCDIDNSSEINLQFNLKNNCSVDIKIVSIGSQKISKKINIDVLHEGNSSESNVVVNACSFGDSKINLIVKSEVGEIYDGLLNQSITGLIMSDNSHITASPILIIPNNKLTATHKLSIGRLDEEKIFYLKTKSLSERDIKFLIISSSLNDVLKNMDKIKRSEVMMRVGSIIECQ